MRKIIIVITVLIALSFIIALLFYFGVYRVSYLDKLGLLNKSYNEINETIGKPLDVNVKEEDGISYTESKCEYFTIVFWNDKNGLPNEIVRVIIDNDKIRFGLFNVRIGMRRNVLEFIYLLAPKIKDLTPNRYGIILRGEWIYFTFNEDDQISQIVITSGF